MSLQEGRVTMCRNVWESERPRCRRLARRRRPDLWYARPMRGFSLAETMIVVAILGVISALAVPKMLFEVQKAQVHGATEGAANFIARVRSEAMRSKRCTQITVTATALTAHRFNTFDCDQGVTPASANLIDAALPVLIPIDRYAPESSKVTFALSTAPATPGAPVIRFRPNGRVFSNDALTNAPLLTNDDAVLEVVHTAIIPLASGT